MKHGSSDAGRSAMLPLALLLLAACGAGQSLQLPPGYTEAVVHRETSLPYALRGFAFDPFAGDLYLSVFHQILRVDAQGRRQVLHSFPAQQGSDMLVLLPHLLQLAYSDPTTQTLYLRDLFRGQTQTLALPKNCYDLCDTAAGQLLCSANPDWPKPQAHTAIYQRLGSGSWRKVIQMQGPSGPLCLDGQGNLYYASQSSIFPTPKGAVQVLRFAAPLVRSALAGGPALNSSQAQVVLRGLDGASDMVFDDRQRLWLSDPSRGGLRRTLPGRMQLEPGAFLSTGPLATLGLQFVAAARGEMDAFQPPAARLFVQTTDWTRGGQVRRISPAPPQLHSSSAPRIPPGPFTLRLASGPASGRALLALSPTPPLRNPTLLFREAGVACWIQFDLSQPFALLPLSLDAQGTASLLLRNPGGYSFTLHGQALAHGLPAGQGLLGSSTLLNLQIQP